MAEVDDLGGTLNLVIVGQVDHAQPEGAILSISPPAGTTVPITSEITITVVKNFAIDASTGATIPL
jgi:beta-lactam-binding protein with PASTA domain